MISRAARPLPRRDQANRLLASCCFAMMASACMPVVPEAGNLARVERFVEAFNDRQPGAMAVLVSEDMRWMSITGHRVSVETVGRDALESAMRGYFRDLPSTRSTLRFAEQSGRFVVAIEEANWESQDGTRQQCSVVVYEFRDTLIRNVWYYPATAC